MLQLIIFSLFFIIIIIILFSYYDLYNLLHFLYNNNYELDSFEFWWIEFLII